MKSVIFALALLSLNAPAAHAGLGDILNTTYLVLCQPASKEGKAALEKMPLDQQVDVKRGRDELITFLANWEAEIEAFKTGVLSSKESAEKADRAELKRAALHFVNTCGMTFLIGGAMDHRGCMNDSGVNLYNAKIGQACAPLMEHMDEVMPKGLNLHD